MCNRYLTGLLALIIVVFAGWEVSYSKWVVIIAAAIILFLEVLSLSKDSEMIQQKTGSKLFMEKTDDELHEGPKRKELEQVMKKKK